MLSRKSFYGNDCLQAVCDPLNLDDVQNLDFLEQHATACYVRLRRTGQIDPRRASEPPTPTPSPSSKNMNNNVSILKLCGLC